MGSIWRRRLACSGAADRLKAANVRARTAALLFGIAGAVFSTAAATVVPAGLRTPFALLRTVSLATATYVTSGISVENEDWLAKWAEKEPEKTDAKAKDAAGTGRL